MNKHLNDFLKKSREKEAEDILEATAIVGCFTKPQFLRLKRDIEFEDVRHDGRVTSLKEGLPGYVLTAESIVSNDEISWSKKEELLERLADATSEGLVYAVVGGYPCQLKHVDCEFLDKMPVHCPGAMI